MSWPSSRPRTPHTRPSSPNPLSLSIADARVQRATEDSRVDFELRKPWSSKHHQSQRVAPHDRSLLPALSKSISTPHVDRHSSVGELQYLRAALAEAKNLLHQQAAEIEALRAKPAEAVEDLKASEIMARSQTMAPSRTQAGELEKLPHGEADAGEMKSQLLTQAAELEELRPLLMENKTLQAQLARLRTSNGNDQAGSAGSSTSIRRKVQAASLIQFEFRRKKARRAFMLMVAGKTSDEPAGIVDDVQSVLMNASRRSQVRRSNSHVRARFKRLGTARLLSVEYSNARDGVVVFGSLHVVMSAHVPPVAGEAARVSYEAASGSPQLVPGGKGLNHAVGLAKLNVPTHLIGRMGKDSFSLIIQEYLQVFTYAHPNLMTEAVRMVRGARTGVGLLVTGEKKCATNIVCHGATRAVGDAELNLLEGILVSHNPKMLLLGTEIPMAANLKAAKLAKEKGTLVALRLGSMRRESVPAVQSLLLDGNVHILCASHGEASLLGANGNGGSEPMETAEDLQRACAILLEEYPSLLYVVVSNHKMYTAGERHRSSTGATEGVQHWSDETGCYYTLPQHHLDHHRKELGSKISGSGAQCAFMSGLAAAMVKGLSIGQGLLWGYAALSACSTVEAEQLPGGMSDLRAVMSMQIGDSLTHGAEQALDDSELTGSPFAAPRYLMQNELHHAVLSVAPSKLPSLEGGFSLEDLGEMALQKDAFGFMPVQRAFGLWARTQGASEAAIASERTLLRRLIEWTLGLFMLLSAVQPSTTKYNLLFANEKYLTADMDSKSAKAAPDPALEQLRAASSIASTWKQLATQPRDLRRGIFKQSAISNLVNTIEGDSWQGSVDGAEDATCLLATSYVMCVLEEAGRKRKERLDIMGNAKLRHIDADPDDSHEAEEQAATKAELSLVVSSCVPLLHKCLLEVSSITTRAGGASQQLSHPFAHALTQCREPRYGRTLLLLAAGAGPNAAPLVDVLISLGAPKLGLLNLYARSTVGRTALHEAGEAENAPVFKMLLERTNLVATGAAAGDLTGAEPLHDRSLAFRTEMEQRIKEGSFPAFLCGGDAIQATHKGAWQALTESLARELDVPATRLSTSSSSSSADSDGGSRAACIRRIGASDVLIVFLTPELVHDPQGLLEMVSAYDTCKKAVGVVVEEPGKGVYEETEAKRVLEEFDRNLWENDAEPNLNPLASAGRKCWNLLDSFGSTDLLVRWRVGDSVDEAASRIEEQMRCALPPEIAVQEYKGMLMIKQFVKTKMAKKRLQKRLEAKELQSNARQQRRMRDGKVVSVPKIDSGNYHLFLSHHWRHGQDAMRVVKQRMLEFSKQFKVFLDVDDLKEGFGGSDIPKSSCILFFFTEGFFSSKNCARELITSYALRKPLQVLLEPDLTKGAVPLAELPTRITSMLSMLEGWGLALELKQAGMDIPTTNQLKDALLAVEPLEWNRLGPFQDVTMRRIAERCLAASELPTCIDAEMSFKQPKLKATSHEWHVYVSQHNTGAATLIDEVSAELKRERDRASDSSKSNAAVAAPPPATELKATMDPEKMRGCAQVLLYLNARTWASDAARGLLCEEIKLAVSSGIPILLAHEMGGIQPDDPKNPRHGCEFDEILRSTPAEVMKLGIYNTIAVPLKDGWCRKASLFMFVDALNSNSSAMAEPQSAGQEHPRGSDSALASSPTQKSTTAQPLRPKAAWRPTWLLRQDFRATRNA